MDPGGMSLHSVIPQQCGYQATHRSRDAGSVPMLHQSPSAVSNKKLGPLSWLCVSSFCCMAPLIPLEPAKTITRHGVCSSVLTYCKYLTLLKFLLNLVLSRGSPGQTDSHDPHGEISLEAASSSCWQYSAAASHVRLVSNTVTKYVYQLLTGSKAQLSYNSKRFKLF